MPLVVTTLMLLTTVAGIRFSTLSLECEQPLPIAALSYRSQLSFTAPSMKTRSYLSEPPSSAQTDK